MSLELPKISQNKQRVWQKFKNKINLIYAHYKQTHAISKKYFLYHKYIIQLNLFVYTLLLTVKTARQSKRQKDLIKNIKVFERTI